MLQTATITFLQKLARNNNKPWFDEHRDDYQQAKDDYEKFAASILANLSVAEPLFREQAAKDCIFRIFRDVRFSKDKTPYKANFGAFFGKGGRKFPGAGYYFHLEPGGKSFVGGGLWMPEAPLLKAVRQEIDYNFDEFSSIIKNKKFRSLFDKVEGEELKTIPQGYTADNPAIAYLKLKSFTVMAKISDEDILAKNLVKNTTDVFTIMRPFIDFLNRSIT